LLQVFCGDILKVEKIKILGDIFMDIKRGESLIAINHFCNYLRGIVAALFY